MATLNRFQVSDSVEQMISSLEKDGAVIIEGFLDQTTVSAINADLDPLLAAVDPAIAHLNAGVAEFFGKHVRHLTGMAGKSKVFAEEVMCHRLYQAFCNHFLLPNCAAYRLNLGHLMERGPGAEAQFLHRDEDVWIHFPRPHFELQLASVVALVDFTKENGATAVVPGSHRWPREREAQGDEVVFAEMPAGSAVVYLGSTLHGGGTNATADQWRRGFHLSYSLGWLRTEENNVLAVPPAVAKDLSEPAQRMLGYGVHDAIEDRGGYLGMVAMQDPMVLLKQGLL